VGLRRGRGGSKVLVFVVSNISRDAKDEKNKREAGARETGGRQEGSEGKKGNVDIPKHAM
jgi:hypothetical protein